MNLTNLKKECEGSYSYLKRGDLFMEEFMSDRDDHA